jgi:hypothetical protein
MIALTLDPTVLVFPDESAAELTSRLSTLRTWNRLQLRHPWLGFSLSRSAKQIVVETGLYPAFHAIKASLGKAGLSSVFSANDISAQVNRLLDSLDLEALTPVEDVLWDDACCRPALKYSSVETRLQTELTRIVVVLAIASRLEGSHSSVVALASPQDSGILALRCTVDVVIPEEVGVRVLGEVPCIVESEVSVVREAEDLYDLVDPQGVWTAAVTAGDLKLGISLRCRERMQASGIYAGWASIPRFYIGEHFVSSLRPCQAHCDGPHARVVLDRSAMVVLRTENIDIKPFVDREGKQRFRGKDAARAYRVHVTTEHEALRLMLWQRPDGFFELANIGLKAELEIAEGDPNRAF